MLKTMVFVGSLTNLTDARYAAGMGVEYLGFVVNAALPQFVEPTLYKNMAEWLAGVKLIGQVGAATPDEVNAQLSQYALHGIATTNPETAAYASEHGLEVFLTIKGTEILQPATAAFLAQQQPNAAYFILENEEDNSPLNDHEKEQLRLLATAYPLVLGYGFDAQNVCSLLDTLPLSGIALRGGGEEIRPGFKDLSDLADVLEQLEAAD